MAYVHDGETTVEGSSPVAEKTSTYSQHVCEHCSKKFWQASTLRDHVDFFHLGLKKYVCGDCGKALETKARLRWHIANDRKCVGSKNNIEQVESKTKVTAAAQVWPLLEFFSVSFKLSFID